MEAFTIVCTLRGHLAQVPEILQLMTSQFVSLISLSDLYHKTGGGAYKPLAPNKMILAIICRLSVLTSTHFK